MSSVRSGQDPASAHTRISPTTIVLVGLMLFAMFFGAGNLIFPPQLGVEAGSLFAPAMLGFLTTGVLLPALAVIAVALSGSGIDDMAARAGRWFGLVFPVLIYLAIGSLYGIPRTATVAYEIGVAGATGAEGRLPLLAFTVVFFAVTLWLVLRPGGVLQALGRWLTPALLMLVVALVVGATIRLSSVGPMKPSPKWADSPVTTGVLEGYLTMDSLAALVFGIVVISALRAEGADAAGTGQGGIGRAASIAALFAAGLLAAVYLGLGHVARLVDSEASNGAALLADVALATFGPAGVWIFGGIVMLACLTTAVGLVSANAVFFARVAPVLGYRTWAVVFAVAGLLVANLGLETIIAAAVPLNIFLYPMAVTLVLVTLAQAVVPWELRWTYRGAIAVAAVFALVDLLRTLDVDPARSVPWLGALPLYEQSLSWVLPVALTAVGCAVVDASARRRTERTA
ncbi:MAG: branched-chain amino acid transport system II carrier protein [Brachybacterium sp.]|nr:branched-chain amino acid transport system II carrier protein [Brachybacterium sp.]